MSEPQRAAPTLQTCRYIWHLARFRPGLYLLLGALEALFFGVTPHLAGLLTRAFFDTLTGAVPARVGVAALIALFVATALARVAVIYADVAACFAFRHTIAALLRKNLFERILDRPGALPCAGPITSSS